MLATRLIFECVYFVRLAIATVLTAPMYYLEVPPFCSSTCFNVCQCHGLAVRSRPSCRNHCPPGGVWWDLARTELGEMYR